jgi:hypothetical protein
MKLNIYWEQKQVSVKLEEPLGGMTGTTPLNILEQIGPKGREMFLEILAINYRAELDSMVHSLDRFKGGINDL